MSSKKTGNSPGKQMTRIRVKLRSFDQRLLDASLQRIIGVGKNTGVHISGPIPLPSKKLKWTILRAPTRFKSARDQFQQVEYKRILDILNPTDKTLSTLKKDISLPPGVDIFVSHIG